MNETQYYLFSTWDELKEEGADWFFKTPIKNKSQLFAGSIDEETYSKWYGDWLHGRSVSYTHGGSRKSKS